MGMDVTGNTGNYFRNNWWAWRPLAEYCFHVAPAICEGSNHCQQWTTNDGSMTADEAEALAAILVNEMASGRTAKYAAERLVRIQNLPRETCTICHGKGERYERVTTDGQVILGSHGGKPWTCNACEGEGTRESWETHYHFSVENVAKWARFLWESGGFELS